jgi:hypothetical protein
MCAPVVVHGLTATPLTKIYEHLARESEEAAKMPRALSEVEFSASNAMTWSLQSSRVSSPRCLTYPNPDHLDFGLP